MRTTLALFRRELGVYFVSPMAYIILTCLMFIFGIQFWMATKAASDFTMPFVFSSQFALMAGLMVLVGPLVTMRLVAEEKSKGTIETLMTAPVTEFQVVLSKYLATLGFLVFLLLPTVAHAILVSKYGTLDVTEAIAGYIGLFLVTASLFAIGLFVSSVCTSQVTAGVISFVVSFFLLLTTMFAPSIPDHTWIGRAAKAVVEVLNPFKYFEDFTRGIIDTRPVVYFLSLIVFFIFLSVRALESRRWR